MSSEDFYRLVGDILGHQQYIPQTPQRGKAGRWNRRLGNGRYPGWGLVRRYGPNNIQVISRKYGNIIFTSETECLVWLADHNI